MNINILYFASVRERLGIDSERVSVGGEGPCISDVIAILRKRGGIWANLFASDRNIRYALDQEFAQLSAKLKPNSELAVFPPITGG